MRPRPFLQDREASGRRNRRIEQGDEPNGATAPAAGRAPRSEGAPDTEGSPENKKAPPTKSDDLQIHHH